METQVDRNTEAQPQVAAPPCPSCPYCGERQSKDEARPSRPILGLRIGKEPRPTHYNDHCRSCGKQIVFGFTFGNGDISQFHMPARYYWSKPV